MSNIYQTFQQHEAAVRRILTRYLSRPEDVDDLSQEVFLRSFAAEIKQQIHDPKAFLLKVAKHVALSEIKRKVNTITDSIEDCGGMEVLVDGSSANVEDSLDSQQRLLVFSQALAELSPELRRAFVLRKVEKLKFKQIANRLNISVSTAEKRAATALVQCHTYLRKAGLDPRDFTTGPRQPDQQGQQARVAVLNEEDAGNYGARQ